MVKHQKVLAILILSIRIFYLTSNQYYDIIYLIKKISVYSSARKGLYFFKIQNLVLQILS